MKYLPITLLLGLMVALNPATNAQVPPEKVLSAFAATNPELEIHLWACEPLLVKPTCMDIDHKGRVWVCESVNYCSGVGGQPLRRPEGDRIVILEDTKANGRADKATTFYQSPEMMAPLGIAVAKDPVGPGYKVFVCQSPDILLFEDKNGNGKADGPPKKLLSGLGDRDHDHGVHGISIGPDMKLYFSVGDQGVRGLVDKNGKKWSTNQTDCPAGTLWRCDLDGRSLELIAHNFRNAYKPCVDSFGNVFVADGDDDGSEQTRICYVMPGGNYGYWPRGPGQSHWHEEQPGVLPKILGTNLGSPTGMCVYEGTLLPKKYWGQLLHTDAGARQVRCHRLTLNGASYNVEREDMVTSTDTWFRPRDICVAPDGSVFVADRYDPRVGGRGMGDVTHGRVYRITPKGHSGYKVPKVDSESKEGVLAALGSPALSVRYMGLAKLHGMLSQTMWDAAWDVAWQSQDPWLRARALRLVLKRSPETSDKYAFGFVHLLEDKDPRFRALAIRCLRDLEDTLRTLVPELETPRGSVVELTLWRVVADPSPAVRREALLALRDADPTNAQRLIFELAKQYDGKDRFYLEAIGIAIDHHDKARRNAILGGFNHYLSWWDAKVLDLIWELQPPQVLPRLEQKLRDPATPTEQRSRIVDIIASLKAEKGERK